MGLVIHASMAKVLLFTPGKTTGGVLPEGIFSLLCEKQCMLQHNALSANIALGDLTSGKRNSFKFKAIIFKKSIYLTQQIFKRMINLSKLDADFMLLHKLFLSATKSQ